MEYKDYYAALGVDKKASQDEIQKAYRKQARKYHPDVNRAASAEDKFKDITEAYEVLKDDEKRRTYDQFGTTWNQRGGPPPGWQEINFDFGGGGSGFSSFFDALFGGGRGGFGGGGGSPFAGFGGQGFSEQGFGRSGPHGSRGFGMGLDQEFTLALTLEEAAKGGKRELSLHEPGSGERKSFTVSLPAGVTDGKKVRLKGKGATAPDGRKGDLYLKIQLRPHRRFRLEGRDLHAELPVSPWHAALGGEASVKTLNGTLKINIPAGSSSGRKIRLRGKGFPNPKGHDGDLFAEIKVMVPETLTDQERELFEKLRDGSSFRPK
ncbi:MAG: J domain-containing protein [Thermoanaerobaculia bacterium]|nr:J domain-containing protein [Thermoanaerobaculia bacterium]